MTPWIASILALLGAAVMFWAGYEAHRSPTNVTISPAAHSKLMRRVQAACRHAGGVSSLYYRNSKALGPYVIVTCVDIYASQKLVTP